MPTYAVWIDTAKKEVDLDEPDCEITDVLNASMAAAEALDESTEHLVVLVRDERTGRLYEAVCTRCVTIDKIIELPPVALVETATAPSAPSAPTI